MSWQPHCCCKNKSKSDFKLVENPPCPPYVYLSDHFCVCLALSSLTPSIPPSLHPFIPPPPPSLSSYLPAAALGLLALTDLPQTKEKDRTTGKKKTQQPSDRSGLLCSQPHTVPSVTLLQTHSPSPLCPWGSPRCPPYQSRLTVTLTAASAQRLIPQHSWGFTFGFWSLTTTEQHNYSSIKKKIMKIEVR